MNAEQSQDKRLPDLAKQVVVCSLANEDFGIPIASVREILEFKKISRIPLSPKLIHGAINHQGKIYTILNLPGILGLPQSDRATGKYILLLQDADWLLGFEVEPISEITFYDEDVIIRGTQAIEKMVNPYVQQILRVNDRIINLIDVKKIVSDFETFS